MSLTVKEKGGTSIENEQKIEYITIKVAGSISASSINTFEVKIGRSEKVQKFLQNEDEKIQSLMTIKHEHADENL